MFRCNACNYRWCLACEAPWHDGQTCKQYKRHVKNEKKSDAKIHATTKACPRCKSRIEKNKGCDHMTCKWSTVALASVSLAASSFLGIPGICTDHSLGTRCMHDFCWLCFADYGRIRAGDNSAHEDWCKYHT